MIRLKRFTPEESERIELVDISMGVAIYIDGTERLTVTHFGLSVEGLLERSIRLCLEDADKKIEKQRLES